jgi:integrase/recombinase XerD
MPLNRRLHRVEVSRRGLDGTRVVSNTLAAYRADLTALARWLAERGTPIIKTTRADLLGFIAFRVEAGARPRSTARNCLRSAASSATSCAKRDQGRSDRADRDAEDRPLALPKSLTEEEVESCSARR